MPPIGGKHVISGLHMAYTPWIGVATVTSPFTKSIGIKGFRRRRSVATIPGTTGLHRGMRDIETARTMAWMNSHGMPCNNDASGVREKPPRGGQERKIRESNRRGNRRRRERQGGAIAATERAEGKVKPIGVPIPGPAGTLFRSFFGTAEGRHRCTVR